jgi:outer membrane receptor for ferrienterochelin and colicins
MGPVKLQHLLPLACIAVSATASAPLWAQTAPAAAPARAAAAAAPASAAASSAATTPARAAPPPAAAGQRVEITGGRESDADQRRQSTAAKIVIGREEIERFGDSTVGEVLKRLPGVTTQGPPGRGGPPRMRGLGGGYTQILIDGQRAPAGFSVDQLTPEQLERIEIFRAPTAETGARAIGGTINIVTREGFKVRLNDLRIGFGHENGKTTPGLFWTHNNSDGDFIYNWTAGLFAPHNRSQTVTTTNDEDLVSGALTRQQVERFVSESSRLGLNVNGRLQWRGEAGDMLMLMPSMFATQGKTHTDFRLTQTVSTPGSQAALYDHGQTDGNNNFATLRLNSQWRTRIPGNFRLELNGGSSLSRGNSHSLRREFDGAGGFLRDEKVDSDSNERSLSQNGKLSKLLEGDHNFVSGWELEALKRNETRVALQNGIKQLGDFEDNLSASSTRVALYAQDEWALNPKWSLHAGVRSETIVTRGDNANGTETRNRAHVATPLVHLLYKPDPKVRDQVRISLTRSYKSPTLGNLVARTAINSRYPAEVANAPTSPDRAGNPNLKPELASGIDIAFERYLSEGGVLSANLFARRLSNYIRNVTTLETVSYSSFQRFVSRPQNVGDAFTAGVELEAKFRLDQAFAELPRIEVRSNLSLFNSRVKQVPGPDNRLDQQPRGTANLGADYRFRGTPLTLGGSLNWTPSYSTRLSDLQTVSASTKRQFDAYALWVFDPAKQLRLNVSNIAPQDYISTNSLDAGNTRERASSVSSTYVNWRLSLELKL